MAITRPGFLETKTELTQAGAHASAPSLSSEFEEKTKPGFFTSGSDADFEVRQHEIAVSQGQLDRCQVNTQVNEARSGAEQIRAQQAEKAKQRTSDMMLMILLDQIADMERGIADQYGENFADELLEDMFENGILTEEERDRIRAIEDINERRHATALAYQDAKDQGRVPAGFEDRHGWLTQEWLDLHKQAKDKQAYQVAQEQKGEITVKEMNASAQYEANTKKADGQDNGLVKAFQEATVEDRKDELSSDHTGQTLVASLDGGALDL